MKVVSDSVYFYQFGIQFANASLVSVLYLTWTGHIGGGAGKENTSKRPKECLLIRITSTIQTNWDVILSYNNVYSTCMYLSKLTCSDDDYWTVHLDTKGKLKTTPYYPVQGEYTLKTVHGRYNSNALAGAKRSSDNMAVGHLSE